MANRKRAGILLGYANILIKNIVNLLYTPMLLSFVGRGNYGVFQTTHSFVFSLSILSLGFSGAYVRFYSQKKTKSDDQGIRVLNGMYLLLFLVICCIAIGLGHFASAHVDVIFSYKFTPEEVELARILTFIMSFNIASTLFSTVFDAFIIVHEEFVFQQTRQILTTLATPLVALILLNCGMGAEGVACAQLAVSLTLLALNARFAIGHLGMRFDFSKFEVSLFSAIAAFSAWIFANQVCELVNQNLPNVLLGALCGSAVAAVFSVALQIRNVFYSLSTTISHVFVPLVNRIVAESDDNMELTKLMTRVGRYQSLVFFWVLGGFAVLGRWFISVWAGKDFIDAYYLILAMTIPVFIPLTQNVGIEIQKAKNMHQARSIAYLIMAVVNMLLTFLLAPSIGYWAPVVGYDTHVILGTGLFMNWYYHTKVGLDMRYYWRHTIPVVVVAIISTGLCLLLTHFIPVTGFIPFMLWGASYSMLFAVMSWFIVLSRSEKDAVLSRAKRLGSSVNSGKEEK